MAEAKPDAVFPSDVAAEWIIIFALSAAIISLSMLSSEIKSFKLTVIDLTFERGTVAYLYTLIGLLLCLVFTAFRFGIRVNESFGDVIGDLQRNNQAAQLKEALESVKRLTSPEALDQLRKSIDSENEPLKKITLALDSYLEALKAYEDNPPQARGGSMDAGMRGVRVRMEELIVPLIA
ncbi:MAG TPA: hypothetical protein VFE80_08210 [Beijerinckiaceae bacterium]|nr:hypothetical protein [Beijerinckiaceae bacterium]HZY22373.1 hypothetical protein [Beijerinckiaceae bacterium]